MVGCCRLLRVRSFALQVRSRSGNDVPVSLSQMDVIICPDKKGQSPKAQLSPSNVPALPKRRQITVGSSFKARSQTCPAVIPEGARHPTQLAVSLLSSVQLLSRI